MSDSDDRIRHLEAHIGELQAAKDRAEEALVKHDKITSQGPHKYVQGLPLKPGERWYIRTATYAAIGDIESVSDWGCLLKPDSAFVGDIPDPTVTLASGDGVDCVTWAKARVFIFWGGCIDAIEWKHDIPKGKSES
jgi:hypothetical protein